MLLSSSFASVVLSASLPASSSSKSVLSVRTYLGTEPLGTSMYSLFSPSSASTTSSGIGTTACLRCALASTSCLGHLSTQHCWYASLAGASVIVGTNEPNKQTGRGSGKLLMSSAVVRQGNKDFSWVQRCVLCGQPGNMRCKRCKGVFYCSAEHQKQHWAICHKAYCVAPPPAPGTTTYHKSLEAVLDIASTFFVHGNVFDSVAVVVTEHETRDVDGRAVTLCTTGSSTGHAVTPEEYCRDRPELYYVAQALNRGLMLALTLVSTMRKLVEDGSKQPGGGSDTKLQLTFTGERVVEFGVFEHAEPHRDNYEGFIFVDGATGTPYGSTVASAADHGLAYVRTKPSNRVHLIDFAAVQFGASSLVNNEAPLFVATAGSERAEKIYGPDRILKEHREAAEAPAAAPATAPSQDWHKVRERSIDGAVKRFLAENDSTGAPAGALRRQMELATAALTGHCKAIFDMK